MLRKAVVFLLSLTIFISAIPVLGEPLTPEVKSAILMEASTGTVLYEQNADEPLPIASVTKLMTVLLTLEEIEKKLAEEISAPDFEMIVYDIPDAFSGFCSSYSCSR